MKSARDRGEFGTWLRSQRKAAGYENVPAARKALQAEQGYGIAQSVWAEMEAGTRLPSAEMRERLEAFFDVSAPSESPGGSEAVLRAIEVQTQWLEKQWAATTALVQHLGDLVQEMQMGRAEGQGRDEALAQILAQLTAAVAPASRPAEAEQRQRSERPPAKTGGDR